MDEIDAIGGRRFSEGTSADREIQRTLMELLNQLDGFDQLGKVAYSFFSLVNKPNISICICANLTWSTCFTRNLLTLGCVSRSK